MHVDGNLNNEEKPLYILLFVTYGVVVYMEYLVVEVASCGVLFKNYKGTIAQFSKK